MSPSSVRKLKVSRPFSFRSSPCRPPRSRVRASQRVDVGAQRLALLRDLQEAVHHPGPERRQRLVVAMEERGEVVPGLIAQLTGQRVEKRLQKVVAALLHEVEERIGKAGQPALLHVVEHLPDGPRHRVVRQTGCGPAVETEGGELAFEHRRRVEEDTGRLDAAREHGRRLGVEVEVVGLARGYRGGERVAARRPARPMRCR